MCKATEPLKFKTPVTRVRDSEASQLVSIELWEEIQIFCHIIQVIYIKLYNPSQTPLQPTLPNSIEQNSKQHHLSGFLDLPKLLWINL